MEEDQIPEEDMHNIGGLEIHFSCLGLGCLAWTTILLGAFTLYTIIKNNF